MYASAAEEGEDRLCAIADLVARLYSSLYAALCSSASAALCSSASLAFLSLQTFDHAPRLDDPSWIHPGNPARNNLIRTAAQQPTPFLPFLPNHPVFYHGSLKFVLITTGFALTAIYFYFPSLFAVFLVGYSTFLMSFVVLMGYHLMFGPRAERRNRGGGAGGVYEPVQMEVIGGMNANGHTPYSAPSLAALQTRPYSPVLGKLFWGAIVGYFGGFVLWVSQELDETTAEARAAACGVERAGFVLLMRMIAC
jgi:hypothetical protein